LPPTGRRLLTQWVSGVDVNVLGPDNMRVVEDAFAYRLVWAPLHARDGGRRGRSQGLCGKTCCADASASPFLRS